MRSSRRSPGADDQRAARVGAVDLAGLRQRDAELAAYLEDVAEQPLYFRGNYANFHSYENHRHLWLLESAAERHAFIDLAFREAAVRFILDRWRARLPSYHRSCPNGFRLYCYGDMAPTVSVVGETGEGCPYDGDLVFVSALRDVLEAYVHRPWSELFSSKATISGETILKAIRAHEGSLNRSARALGLPLAELRRQIEVWGLGSEVNRLRKHHRRRPASFRDDSQLPFRARIWEEIVPPPT